jgi:hypothetical protein
LESSRGVVQKVEKILSILFFSVHDLHHSFQENLRFEKLVFVKVYNTTDYISILS